MRGLYVYIQGMRGWYGCYVSYNILHKYIYIYIYVIYVYI